MPGKREPSSPASPISTPELLSAVKLIARHLRASGEVSTEELRQILTEADAESIPLQLFEHEKLSSLEIVCKYLKENRQKSFRQIGQITGRDERTIWVTYRNANKKLPSPLTVTAALPAFPVDILRNRSLSVLGSIVLHLSQAYSVQGIARLLHKPYSTIWATLKKARRKDA